MPKHKHIGKHRPKKKSNKTGYQVAQTKIQTAEVSAKKTVKSKGQAKNKSSNVIKTKSNASTKSSKNVLLKKLFGINFIRSKSVYIAVGVLVLFVGITAVYGYKGYRQAQVQNYKSAIYSISVNSSESITSANNLYFSFEGSLIVDESAANNFNEVADMSKRASLALDTLSPPAKFKKNHNRMISLFKVVAKTYAALGKFCRYVGSRNKILETIGNNANIYSAKVKEARRRAEAVSLATTAYRRLMSAYKQVAKMRKGKNSNKDALLVKYMVTLKSQLAELQAAVNNKSRYKSKGALDVIAEEYNQKWSKAFVSSDNKYVERFKSDISKIQVLNKQISY